MESGTSISLISGRQAALVCGLPSSSTYLAADLCRDMMTRKHDACEVIGLNDLGAETIDRISAAAGPVVFLAEAPDHGVVRLAAEANLPIIVIDQDFAAACREFMGARSANLPDTARTLARAQIGVRAFADIPRTTLIRIDKHAAAVALVSELAAVLGIEDSHWRAMVEARDLGQPLWHVLDTVFAYDKVLPSEEIDGVLDRLDRFYGLQHDRWLGPWEIPLDLLVEGKPPHLPATNPIDLLGPARCLIYGPYLHLPAGRWNLRFRFATADNDSTNLVSFDVLADEEFKFIQDYELRITGKFEFKCDFRIDNPFYPFEFRTHLRRGAIGGMLAPSSLIIEPAE